MDKSLRDVVVVLDACEIHRDWQLAGIDFQFLRFLTSPQSGLTVVLPDSVVIEVVANQERWRARRERELRKALVEYRHVSGRDRAPFEFVPSALSYADQLRGRLESLGFETHPTPSAAHDQIAARAADRRPPFDESGSGYRDTLVWLTCVDLAAEGKRVILASSDNDFATAGELAPALASEVADLPGSVTLVRKLVPWLTTLIPWQNVSDIKEAAAMARDEEVAAMFAPWDMFEDPQLTAEELGLPPSSEIHDVSYAGSGGMWIDRKSFKSIGRGKTEVVYEFPIEFEVDMTMSSSDAEAAGYVVEDLDPGRPVTTSTVVEMIGEMTVVHDEHDTEDGNLPYYFDTIDFRLAHPGPEWPIGARSPVEPPGTPTLFDE